LTEGLDSGRKLMHLWYEFRKLEIMLLNKSFCNA
jgi:hypothetical protein